MFDNLLNTLLVLALTGTAITLIIGVFSIFRARTSSAEKSNKLMRLRIVLQSLALIFLAILLFKGQ